MKECWSCNVWVDIDEGKDLPKFSDVPPRTAVREAIEAFEGVIITDIESGWGAAKSLPAIPPVDQS